MPGPSFMPAPSSRPMTTWDVRSQLQAEELRRQNTCTFDPLLSTRQVRNYGPDARETLDERFKAELATGRIKTGRVTKPNSNQKPKMKLVDCKEEPAASGKPRCYRPPTIKMFSRPTKRQIKQDFVREQISKGEISFPAPAPASEQDKLVKKEEVKPEIVVLKKEDVKPVAVPRFGTGKPKIR